MPRSFVYSRLPRAGLGNKLLVWAKAEIFAKQNGLQHYTSRWADLKLGPYIRGERSKRHYQQMFSKNCLPPMFDKLWMMWAMQKTIEPDFQSALKKVEKNQSELYVFNTVPDWKDYFLGLRGHEIFLRDKFYGILHQRVRNEFHSFEQTPIVGLHVRRGDFRELKSDEKLGKDCNVRTPISYYINVLTELRELAGKELPATIFTDGRHDDVKELLEIPNVEVAQHGSDVLDMLMLSKSKVIVPSIASTFSYWAAFISDAVVITHPAHDVRIRGEELTKKFFEGTMPKPVPDRERLATRLRAAIEQL